MRPPHAGSYALWLAVFLCLVLTGLLATGCAVTYGNRVESHFLESAPDTTRPLADNTPPSVASGKPNADTTAPLPAPAALPESLDIYFAGNPPPFTYQSLGFLEVQGARYTSPEEVFNRLKYEAILRRADAITEVKRTSLRRETGSMISEKAEVYASVAMTAIAARYTEGRKPTTPLDSGVRKQVLQSMRSEDKTTGIELFFSLVMMPVILVSLLIANSKQ